MWTEQTVETLKRLALEGRSAASIAAALGAPSRNAVIGKANRIGIRLSGARSAGYGDEPHAAAPPALTWKRKRSPSVEGRRGVDASWEGSVFRPGSRAPAVSRPKRRENQWTFADAEVGEMRRIGFANIGEAECRWPLGDPTEEDFVYCGLQTARGRAYCPGHCRLVYRRPNS